MDVRSLHYFCIRTSYFACITFEAGPPDVAKKKWEDKVVLVLFTTCFNGFAVFLYCLFGLVNAVTVVYVV